MAHLDYSERFDRGHADGYFSALYHLTKDWVVARTKRHAQIRQQKLDRKAFQALACKEDWLLRDMGIHRGDVEFLANQPTCVNAARELEKIRSLNHAGR